MLRPTNPDPALEYADRPSTRNDVMDPLRIPAFTSIALLLMLMPACRKTDPVERASADGNAMAVEASRHVRSSELDRFDHVMSRASISCGDSARGLDCSMGNADNGDTFDVRMYSGCGAAGVFGGVTANANLFDRYPPKSGAWPASFRKGQFVCVLAEAGATGEAYLYYVVEAPTASVADCTKSSLCKDYGDRPVKWHVPRAGAACRATGVGSFEGDCAIGWIEAEKIEVFTMGLVPEPDYPSP